MTTTVEVTLKVNGQTFKRRVSPRVTLADFLREELGLTGTHLGCEQGSCGACTVTLDNQPVRSCIMFAVQADNRAVTTVEGLGGGEGLHPLQEAFLRNRAFQCGFCTPGMLMLLAPLVDLDRDVSVDEIRSLLASNICRCTGYQPIVLAVLEARNVVDESIGRRS